MENQTQLKSNTENQPQGKDILKEEFISIWQKICCLETKKAELQEDPNSSKDEIRQINDSISRFQGEAENILVLADIYDKGNLRFNGENAVNPAKETGVFNGNNAANSTKETGVFVDNHGNVFRSREDAIESNKGYFEANKR